ncbi:MAG: hypothetical protein WD426_13180 [Anditalea sp.]
MSDFEILENEELSSMDLFENIDNSETSSPGLLELSNRNNYSVYNVATISLVTGILMLPCKESVANPSAIQFEEFRLVENQIGEYLNVDADITTYLNEVNSYFFKNFTKKEIIYEILSFKALSNNWDGYGAIPLEIKSAANTIVLIELIGEDTFCAVTDFYPNPNGTITLTWDNKLGDIISAEIGNESMSYFVDIYGSDPLFFDNIEINDQEGKKISEFISRIL